MKARKPLSMSADEFEIIRTLFAPLANDASARRLVDDAAVLEMSGALVVTTDAIVEGVHFLADDPIETVAMKALRVNVSDIVGKGARPTAALLTLIWPDQRPSEQIKDFAQALSRDLEHFNVALIGGDTTSTPGPLTVSVTMFGKPLGPRTPSRADAKPGEDLWLIGGEIGSAWLGHRLRTGVMSLADLRRGRDDAAAQMESDTLAGVMPDYLSLPGQSFDAEAAWLMSTYLAPFVRTECAPIVARFAGASMDVSDGLVSDAAKLAEASGVALHIEAASVPISIPAQRWVQTGGDLTALLTAGDDYVVLFTAAHEQRDAIEAQDDSLRPSRIGHVEAGAGVTVLDEAGRPLRLSNKGYAHRLGR
jgi:thiamine-monophosphate kinase